MQAWEAQTGWNFFLPLLERHEKHISCGEQDMTMPQQAHSHLLGVRLEVITPQFQVFTKWLIVQQPPNLVYQWLQLLKLCSRSILKCSRYIWIVFYNFLEVRFGTLVVEGALGRQWAHTNKHSYSMYIGPVTTVQWRVCWDKEILWASTRAWKSAQCSSWQGQAL